MLKTTTSVINASQITGVLPVLNGGTGVTTSTGTGNTVLSAAPTLSGNVTLSTGNLVIGTSGKGIDFSATSSGSGTMTSELLSDYEEGDWTPTLTRDVAPALTYTAQVGKYVKVGRQVTLNGSLFYTVTSSGSGLIYIAGFPFASNSTSSYSASGSAGYVDSIVLGADSIYVGQTSSTGVLTLNGNFATGVLSSGRLYFTITYQV